MWCELPVEQFCTPLFIPYQLAVEAHRLIVRHTWLSVELFDGAPQFSSALTLVDLFQEFSPFGSLVGMYHLGNLMI